MKLKVDYRPKVFQEIEHFPIYSFVTEKYEILLYFHFQNQIHL
jgi:hypothetical protein